MSDLGVKVAQVVCLGAGAVAALTGDVVLGIYFLVLVLALGEM